ncbi:MAG: asparagine synthase (glutamine-hydrolyzing) [Pseudomonadota bacterium]
MCGIVGIMTRDGSDPSDLSASLDLMAHRGPDGAGQWLDRIDDDHAISLGHRRLSIIDLSEAARQPMVDATGRYCLTFNGEIYNYRELRSDLKSEGLDFETTSDSEVLLYAYAIWGPKCLDRLNGMFGFAVWDRVDRTLFAARDRFGEKPFYFVAKPRFFAFASEYKALLSTPGVSWEYDETRLLAFAINPGRGCDADRQTVFYDVQQLLPGEALAIRFNETEPRIRRYYEPQIDHRRARHSDEEIFAEFRELLTDSVRLRLRSDMPVGSCLSGGLDSSAIVCIADKEYEGKGPYKTFTGQFPSTDADETQFAREVIAATTVESHFVTPTVDSFIDEIGAFMWHNELPVSGASQYAQWCIFRAAKEAGVTVLLDGQGADELLGGYESYFRDYVRTDDCEAGERGAIALRYAGAVPGRLAGMKEALPFAAKQRLSRIIERGTDLRFALTDLGLSRLQSRFTDQAKRPTNPLSNALLRDSFGGFLTTLLRYGDRNSMAHSCEVRLPFCDHRIADFACSVGPRILMGDAQTKRLLREAMRGILPETIRTRWRKQGFNPPIDQWFRSSRLMELWRDELRSGALRNSPLWSIKHLNALADRAQKGERGLGNGLWQPLQIELWRRHFLGSLPRHAVSSPSPLKASA